MRIITFQRLANHHSRCYRSCYICLFKIIHLNIYKVTFSIKKKIYKVTFQVAPSTFQHTVTTTNHGSKALMPSMMLGNKDRDGMHNNMFRKTNRIILSGYQNKYGDLTTFTIICICSQKALYLLSNWRFIYKLKKHSPTGSIYKRNT